MAVSSDIISEFAKVATADETQTNEITYMNGEIVESNGTNYVRFDGSDMLTPIASSLVGVADGNRVTVQIRNHSVTVTGNISDPSANKGTVDDLEGQIAEFGTIVADVVTTDVLEAQIARIDSLVAEDVLIKGELEATNADIVNLEATKATIEQLNAVQADIDDLDANKLDAEVADLKYATIENLDATNADIRNLEADYADFKVVNAGQLTAIDAAIDDLQANTITTDYLDAHYADIDFANINQLSIENFFSKSGMIEDLVVGDQTITGKLVGVTIVGDLIEGGTIKADKLVVQGTDGLYYKLNVSGETVAAEQTEYNSLNGSIITAQSITADKVKVTDLVAFGATIGGFTITDSELYSGVKESATNATRGVYMSKEGEFAVGDGNNYLKYYHDTATDTYKLDISAGAIKLSASNKDLDQALEEVNDKIDNIDVDADLEVGVRNLALGTGETQNTSNQNGYIEYEISEFGQGLFAPDERFTISFDAMSTLADVGIDAGLYSPAGATHSLAGCRYYLTTEWVRYIAKGVTLTNGDATTVRFTVVENATSTFTMSLKNVKVERGITATDWTLAPEEMATGTDIDDVQSSITDTNASLESTNERLSTTESSLQILSDGIRSLTSDENGATLITQTADGWTFNSGAIKADLNEAIDNLADDNTKLANKIKDIVDVTSYITMGEAEDGSPYIELGTSEGYFKVRITNEAIDFLEGTTRIAYITNQQLYIGTATIQTDLRIGDAPSFIWRRRANGNLGLRWEA